MNCSIEEYLKEVEDHVKAHGSAGRNLGKEVIYAISNSKVDAKIIKAVNNLLTQKAKGQTKVLDLNNGSKFEGEITDVKMLKSGMLEVVFKTNDKSYIYEVDPSSGVSDRSKKIISMEGFEYKLFHKNDSTINQFGGFSRPLAEASRKSNEYASRIVIGVVDANSALITPYIQRLHTNLKRNINLYNEVSNLISNSFGDLAILDKIKASMFVTGDIDRKQLADLTSIENQITRRNYQILQDDLPKLHKRVQKAVPNKEYRKRINQVFGKINLGSLPTDIMVRLVNEENIEDIIASIKTNKDTKDLAKAVKDFMLYRKVSDKNVQNTGYDQTAAALATLYALSEDNGKLYNAFKVLKKKDEQLHSELVQLSITVSTLNKAAQRGTDAKSLGKGGRYQYHGYDEHGTMDVFETTKEFKVVTLEEYDRNMGYEKTPWTIVQTPTKNSIGIIARKSTNSAQKGLGTGENRIANGIFLDTNYVKEQIKAHGKEWLVHNNVVFDEDNGYTRYRKVLTQEQFEKAGGMNEVAHTLWRSYVHNKALIETEKARQMIVDNMTINGNEGALKVLNHKIRFNKTAKVKDRKVLKPFIKTNMSYDELKKNYPEVARKYKKVTGVTNYGKFNEEITYVRNDMADMIIGYSQKNLVPDEYPVLQSWERVYKELLQLFKLKLVVANPAKLGVDLLSNIGILMTMDVPVDEALYYGKEAISLSHEMSKIETELVNKKVQLSLAEASGKDTAIQKIKVEVDKIQKQMEEHPYYEAIQKGFVQSLGTEMILKNFDTVSGLQHTIDSVVEKIVKDKSGNPNVLHKALVTWMNAGFGVNDVLDAVGNMSKIKGTSFGEELTGMAARLKEQKTNEDTVRYISEFIAAPSSEVVRQGSRFMQMGDAITRWALYNTRVKQGLIDLKVPVKDVNSSKELQKIIKDAIVKGKITQKQVDKIKNSAGVEALDTFIDYRLNMPKEVQMLSDYGILMFPSFWVRAQKVIYNLAKYHPLNAGGGFLVADLLNLHGASILDANILSKAANNNIVHAGQDVLSLDTFFMHIFNMFK